MVHVHARFVESFCIFTNPCKFLLKCSDDFFIHTIPFLHKIGTSRILLRAVLRSNAPNNFDNETEALPFSALR